MSGSSHAENAFSRCEVAVDAGISISWAPDPDGSYEHGHQHHLREEAHFRSLMHAATPALEVLFDELETAGHVFTPPTDARFSSECQRGHGKGLPVVEVRVWCRPPLGDAQLQAVVARVEKLVLEARPPPEPPRASPPEPAVVLGPAKPWWKFW